MKKRLLLALLLLIAMLSGCSSGPDYKVKMTKDLFYQKDTQMPFEIKVTENNKTVKGLDAHAQLSMTSMDHGTYDVKLSEGQDGTYTGKVKLAMGGKYELALTLEKDGKKTEKVIDYVVKKPQGVATINGKWITNEDVDFYKFINYLQLAINRETAQKQYSGKELDEEMAYLDTQEKTAEDKNQLLTQIIRLRAVAMLADEKGHKATDVEVDTEMSKVSGQYNQYESAKAMIKEFGEEKFWKIEKEQYKMIVLMKMVQQDLVAQMKKENPKAGDQEISYLAQQKYEELLVSQVNSLKIEIL
jgi:hypothetical protein